MHTNMKKRITIMLAILVLSAAAHADGIQVLTEPGAPSPVRIAARELADYLQRLYPDASGKQVRLVANLPAPESYQISVTENKAVIAGGGPRGVVCGVYALLEKLGCGFHFSGDTLPPARTGLLSFKDWPLANKPLVGERIVFNWHNFLSGCSTWNLADWNRWTEQSQKMGYNAIMVHAYGNNPMAGFSFQDMAKPVGYLSSTMNGRDWSTMHVNDVRRLWGGEVFDKSVFGADAGMVPDNQRVPAAQELMQGVFTNAAERGMGVVFAVDVDTPSANPPELVRLLPESARFEADAPASTVSGSSARRIWLPNPDTTEGYAFYRAQVVGLMKTYPLITKLVVWFRHDPTPWINLKVSDMPASWQKEWADEIAKTPGAGKYWHAPGIFAVGKIVRAFERALKECGAEKTRLAAGTWGFGFLNAADRFFPKDVELIGLDYDVLHGKPQLGTAESRAPLREIGARRPVIPIIWAHHDDGHYIGRPYTPFSDFHSKLTDANASGFGIIHWTTRPLDLFFASHARQVFENTKDESLRATCDHVGGMALGEYLHRWVTEAPRFGRDTSDLFIDRPLANIPEVVNACSERLKLLEKVDVTVLTETQRTQLEYFKGFEQFIASFFEAHGKFQDATAALDKRDLSAARTALADCKAEKVIEQFAKFSSSGGITRGEQGLVVSMNTRWLPPIVRLRQRLAMEPVRYNFGPTSHDPLAQMPGAFTFHFDDQRKLWQTLGAKETGAETFRVPDAADGIGRSGIESGQPIILKMGPIYDHAKKPVSMPAGDYRLRVLMLDPTSTAAGQREFSITASIADDGTKTAAPATLAERVDVFAEAGGRQRLLERVFDLKLRTPSHVTVTLKPLKGKSLISGLALEPANR